MRLERLNNLPLNTVTPNFVAIFVFFGRASSFTEIISSSETEANREAILFLFGCSEVNSTWLITSELANQRTRKVLFTCVVYTNMQISYGGWRSSPQLIVIFIFNHGGKFSQGRQHGENSCHRAHHCGIFTHLFWHRWPCSGILLDRLWRLRYLDGYLGELCLCLVLCRSCNL